MKKWFNNKGLTLIEIIVTLAVLGIIISPLMSMFVTSQKINNESKKEYKAIQLAQKYMEGIKSQDYFSETGYTKEEKSGKTVYTRSVTDEDFFTEIILTQAPISVSGTNIGAYPKLAIKNNNVDFNGNNIGIEEANVHITFNADGTIKVEENISTLFADGIYVSIETSENPEGVTPEVKLFFTNSAVVGKVYLNGNGNKWSATYSGGKKPEIISVKKDSSIDILYDIEINVYKDSKNDDNLVTTLESTNIFK